MPWLRADTSLLPCFRFDNSVYSETQQEEQLEGAQNRINSRSYSEALISRPQCTRILEKLEFFSSKEESERSISQAFITHPSVNSDNQQSGEKLKETLTSVLKMPCHEIDANLHVQKTNKTKLMIVHFIDQRLKRPVYAKKNLVAPVKKLLRISN